VKEKFKYDINKYCFVELLQDLYGRNELRNLHKILQEKDIQYNEIFDIDSDNKTWFHNKFYERINNYWKEFDEEYIRFLKDEISPHFSEEIIFQTNPTFRVHIPNNVAVGTYDVRTSGFHRDSDEGYNHPISEINIYLPLTRAHGTNTIWSESETDKEDFSPMEAEVGEYYIWKGSKLSHGNKLNDTEETRVSFDFRVTPKSKYDSNFSNSSRDSLKKFVIGDYYRTFEK
tara:strand:- start:201 stop:890 length:690 start_codon:yes stop_codon:yes gene_type:complete